MELYDRIKARREALGMSQDELAKRLGYKSRSTIARIEAGGIDITQSKIASFAEALQLSPGYLMGWEDESQGYYVGPEAADVAKAFSMLSETGKTKLKQYLRDLSANPENVDPNKMAKDLLIDNLSEEAKKRRSDLAKELRMLNKQERAIKRHNSKKG